MLWSPWAGSWGGWVQTACGPPLASCVTLGSSLPAWGLLRFLIGKTGMTLGILRA